MAATQCKNCPVIHTQNFSHFDCIIWACSPVRNICFKTQPISSPVFLTGQICSTLSNRNNRMCPTIP